MPKLKETEEQQKNNLIRAFIAKNMIIYNLSDEQVAIKIRCAKRTFQSKKKRPETFTLGELRRLCIALKLSDEEKLLIV